ncbi:MAG: sigma 54-interacting transcriptional regulator [Bacteroidetes bacterium]|nr:sigma 54-interacting transcriptional regulator [Bacteroidota bacterium]
MSEIQQRYQKLLGDSMSQFSSEFMELTAHLKADRVADEVLKKVEKLFKLFMEYNRKLGSEASLFFEQLEKLEKSFEQVQEAKRQYEVLYASGILFSSEKEMKMLMEKAVTTVVKEVHADQGFIILTDDAGEIQEIVSCNMDPEKNPEAKELSLSVVKATVSNSQPMQMGSANDAFVKQQSVVRLGITSAVCVPLVSKTKVFGAVYLDRRNKEHPFIENDLVYLLAFARQIVRGFEISMEISSLEKKLLFETVLRFEDLRKEFSCERIVGSSKKLFEVLKVAAKIAPTDASVIILGENGTGKDLLAHVIHENSRRASGPFVTINCGAIPDNLLESELFGYESGAFTGATKSKPGKIELADGGTLFLDEIGELNVNLQAKLLRVIQTKEIERLGSIHARKIDLRFIVATNKNITEMVEQNSFREDLYYRLRVIELLMPPLRERREDILDLANYFIRKYAEGKNISLSTEALTILENYHWPGNVRELDNIIQRAVVLMKQPVISAEDLPPEIIDDESLAPVIVSGKTLEEAETEFRKMYIIRALRQAKSKSEAAQMLGINRTHFHRLLAQLQIEG